VLTEGYGRGPDGLREASIGRPVALRQSFEIVCSADFRPSESRQNDKPFVVPPFT
jgi:hypothetical protein